MQFGVLVKTGAQVVIRNLARKVVNVMEADRPGQPIQNARQIIIRAPANGRPMELPTGRISPISVCKLMLYVEEPDADRRRKQQDR